MTLNQIIAEIKSILQLNAMIRTVKNVDVKDWLKKETNPELPVAVFNLLNGSVNLGRQQVFTFQFFFLDKSGQEHEFENDVISDQFQIAADFIEKLRGTQRTYYIDDNIAIGIIKDQYEDFLAGVTITINFNTTSDFDGCNYPT